MKKQSHKHDNGLPPDYRISPITPDDIRTQLNRVLSSPDLEVSKKVKTICRYLTEEKLTGREDLIDVQRIANKIHNRPLNSDASLDLLIRIQVNQLRPIRMIKWYDADVPWIIATPLKF